MAEIGEHVTKITVAELEDRMNKMKIGEVIGLAANIDEDGDPENWFAIKRIDLESVDAYESYWIIIYFGGSSTPAILSSMAGPYFRADLLKVLKDKELLQEDGRVLIDSADLTVKEG